MKILEDLRSMTWKDAAMLVVLIVVLAPGLKAGLGLLGGLIGFAAGAIK